jgi:RHS repeat-associated protein
MIRPVSLEKNHRHPNLEKTVSLREKLRLTLGLCVATAVACSLLTTGAAAQSSCGLCDTKTATLDGMGRVLNIKHPSVFGREIEVDGSYDQLGRLAAQSNAYFPAGFGGSDATTGTTFHQYDGLDREIATTLSDGSMKAVSYHGNCTITTDEAGSARRRCADGLGRLIEVDEPGPSAGTAGDPTGLNDPYVTLYFYGTDASGNSTVCIEQHGSVPSSSGCSAPPSADATSQWRIRRAAHDSLGHLISASNPETGTIAYTYDAKGNVLGKTSPAPNQPAGSAATVTISYAYDQLDRVVGKYDGPSTNAPLLATYAYDTGPNAIGQQTFEASGPSSHSTSYDAIGRIISQTQTINSISNTTRYTYHLDGSIASMQYPSGLTLTYGVNQDGNLVSAVDQNGYIYVCCSDYNASNLLQGVVTGTTVQHTTSYNQRLQPTRLQAQLRNGSTGAIGGTIFDLSYDFHQGHGDNGNVYQIVNNRDPSRSQTFGYDALNRVVTGYNAGTGSPLTSTGAQPDCFDQTLDGHNKYWGQNFTYDPWGNLVNVSINKCGAESFATGANNKNQLADLLYDAAGNTLSNGNVATYDTQSRLISYNGQAYGYDAAGGRVIKTNGTDGTLYWSSTQGTSTETDLKGNILREYVYFNHSRIALITHGGGATQTTYNLSDFLGSSSMMVDGNGNILNESDFTPFGGERIISAAAGNPYRFTGKERDAGGFDDFGARYYVYGVGRFLTPDWSAKPQPFPYADLGNPQSLNLYGYAGNNPVSKKDEDGHCDWCERLANLVKGKGWNTNDNLNQNTTPLTQQQRSPVPTVLNNGATVQNPWTNGPLVKPASVSLTENANVGEYLSKRPFGELTGGLVGLFARDGSEDYQRTAAQNGQSFDTTYADFGNFNFGVVAAAAGLTFEQAVVAAGLVNATGGGNKSGPVFNDPRNLYFIQLGYDAYNTGQIGPLPQK